MRRALVVGLLASCWLPARGEAIDCAAVDPSVAGRPASLHDADASPLLMEFDSGARWELCWHLDERAGLVLSRVHYGAPRESSRQVLDAGSLGQILFRYDEDVRTAHLLAEPGLGGRQVPRPRRPGRVRGRRTRGRCAWAIACAGACARSIT